MLVPTFVCHDQHGFGPAQHDGHAEPGQWSMRLQAAFRLLRLCYSWEALGSHIWCSAGPQLTADEGQAPVPARLLPSITALLA